MDARNATYDVLWRVPDKGLNSIGVPCYGTSSVVGKKNQSFWCSNSSFFPHQTWSMAPGLLAATSVAKDATGDSLFSSCAERALGHLSPPSLPTLER